MKHIGIIASPFMALGLYVIYASLSMSIWNDGPQEGFFPFTLGGALVALSGALFFQGMHAEPVRSEPQQIETVPHGRAFYYYAAVLFFYSLTLEPLGFLLSTAVSLIVLVRFIERESWPTALMIAVGFNFLFYLLFAMLLGVSLPRGPLENLLQLT